MMKNQNDLLPSTQQNNGNGTQPPHTSLATKQEVENLQLQTDCKLIEQELRPFQLLKNYLRFRKEDDPRKKAASKAIIWRLFFFVLPAVGTVTIIAGTVFSQILTYRQVILIGEQNMLLLDAELNSQMFNLTNVIVQKPELRPYFYDGVSVESAPVDLLPVILSLSEAYVDFFEQAIERSSMMNKDVYASIWGRYIEDMFKSSDAIHCFFHDKRNWYGTTLNNFYLQQIFPKLGVPRNCP